MIELNKITETITNRFSCRTYQDNSLQLQQVEQITAMIDAHQNNFLNAHTRFLLISAGEDDSSSLKSLGTYGTIRNPTGFITGATQPSQYDMESFGYRMEEIVLYATQLNLGTCWLGGFFTRSSFARKIQLNESETIPAVTAIGLIDENRGVMDRLIRHQARAHKRLPWETLFFDEDFSHPLGTGEAKEFASALEMVRLGPSASNKQPWRIIRQGNQWHFYLQRTPNYPPGILKLADLQRVDIGIAMCHFALTTSAQGLAGKWESRDPALPLPDKNTRYTITWVPQ